MKVLCIDDKIRPGEMIMPGGKIKEGETYNAIETVTGYSFDPVIGKFTDPKACYRLAEFTSPTDICFETDRFIPLSNIDELTFNRNYQKELV